MKPPCAICRPCARRGPCAASRPVFPSAAKTRVLRSLARLICAMVGARVDAKPSSTSGRFSAFSAKVAPGSGSPRRALAIAGSPPQPPESQQPALGRRTRASACSGCRDKAPSSTRWIISGAGERMIWPPTASSLALKIWRAMLSIGCVPLTPHETLRKAGLLSKNCWLKDVRKTLCYST